MLLKAGFTSHSRKGSRTNWSHPLLPGKVTLSTIEIRQQINDENKQVIVITIVHRSEAYE
ncbi:hypothetical protein [Rivularia sp. UHCC 0363]|uniref:type II toxin-antitoxin system RelE family toxin n=1 Tax=Rivularia sp. UHCC 0363 TaxID=3110244 RepID=UPI002B20D4C7|nr:hypothetical protein [Rivularia sp. UHCC 0363]MEA5593081.1 hypothetical protein [Rivularia sp. UHCC 0363]